ncbi:MAG: DUF4404 family protein [Lentisphaerae bacterium]|nr:DUF4404 family protein [Lentisphaerota bacterium]
MIEDTIARIRERLDKSNVDEARRQELSQLLSTLSAEVKQLAETRGEHAESIGGFAEISALEATRLDPNPQSLQHALNGLGSSVEGFEASHPKLVEIVNSFCHMLSNIGI